MAIKVNGTTVIDDNRNLVNIVSGAGSSTDVNGVGTYTVAHDTSQSLTTGTGYKEGRTTAGSNLDSAGISGGSPGVTNVTTSTSGTTGLDATGTLSYYSISALQSNQTYSGSWRLMSPAMRKAGEGSSNWGMCMPGLWVRYS
jgi:hypothetical protein